MIVKKLPIPIITITEITKLNMPMLFAKNNIGMFFYKKITDDYEKYNVMFNIGNKLLKKPKKC
ncbi:hypothetical protein CQU01_03860 [Cerasibacillus quisquiliarum]|uniref:Uncharacterized protein n=1 Tax=Cerasibacillus quisquiliarum TaxID=227865 RepID=A0A511UWM2_9BACI|nr:hypothetical protein CQU01_03860 [Cerasibacillus quisquiliarum]